VHYSTRLGGFWMQQLEPFYESINVIGRCPEASQPNADPNRLWGGTFTAWGPDNVRPESVLYGVSGSYAINGWIYGDDVDMPGLRGGERYGVGPRDAWHTLPAKDSSDVPAFADSGWVDTWPYDTDAPGDLVIANGGMMPRVCIKRHNNRFCNVSFLDGHAESVLLPNLWKLKWSKVFDTSKVPPRMPPNFGRS